MNATPHVAQNTNGRRSSAIDGRTTRHAGYGVSQRIRKRIEEAFGWINIIAGQSEPSSAAASASDGPSPSRPPPTIWRGCRSSWRPRREGPGELPTDRPLADRRGGPSGQISPRSLRPGEADDHRAGRRNRLRRPGSRSRSRIRPRLRSVSTGPDARKATRSRAKALPNSSTTAPSRSSSNTETATKPSSKRNGTLLQQPGRTTNGL